MDTIKPTGITFDPAKNEANVRERGLPFSHVVVYAPAANSVRVISFRKANKREVRRYGKATQP